MSFADSLWEERERYNGMHYGTLRTQYGSHLLLEQTRANDAQNPRFLIYNHSIMCLARYLCNAINSHRKAVTTDGAKGFRSP